MHQLDEKQKPKFYVSTMLWLYLLAMDANQHHENQQNLNVHISVALMVHLRYYFFPHLANCWKQFNLHVFVRRLR